MGPVENLKFAMQRGRRGDSHRCGHLGMIRVDTALAADCVPCPIGRHLGPPGPRRLPRRQHVGLSDPHPATDTEHRYPLSRRSCRRIGGAAPAAAEDPRHLDRGAGSPTRRRSVHHGRCRAIDRLDARRNPAGSWGTRDDQCRRRVGGGSRPLPDRRARCVRGRRRSSRRRQAGRVQ